MSLSTEFESFSIEGEREMNSQVSRRKREPDFDFGEYYLAQKFLVAYLEMFRDSALEYWGLLIFRLLGRSFLMIGRSM